jgi:hypothetical protein
MPADRNFRRHTAAKQRKEGGPGACGFLPAHIPSPTQMLTYTPMTTKSTAPKTLAAISPVLSLVGATSHRRVENPKWTFPSARRRFEYVPLRKWGSTMGSTRLPSGDRGLENGRAEVGGALDRTIRQLSDACEHR